MTDIVEFRVTRSIKIQKGAPSCSHTNVELDVMERVVNCTECGAVVEPFEYILSWAKQERRFEMEVEYLKTQLTKLKKEEEELRKNISYMKRKAKASNMTVVKITDTKP